MDRKERKADPTARDAAAGAGREVTFARLRTTSEGHARDGREIVVVVGLGFVGTVMAAVVADATDQQGRPTKHVIGYQRPSERSSWKIDAINRGESPVTSEDPEVGRLLRSCVVEKKTLVATDDERVIGLADVVIVDVQCDYVKTALGDTRSGWVDMQNLEGSFEMIGALARAEALILIETTVAPGTTEQIAFPIIKRGFEKRAIGTAPLLAHSYERVMPGRNYVASVRDFWRVCSGISEEAKARVVAFLRSVLNTDRFPLTVLDRPIESETAKIIENSYRSVLLAFMDEWSSFAEKNGVDLKKVIEAIKVRPTHSNIMFPGPGIGGYCLPKDGALGVWAYKHILGWEDEAFKMTPLAIDINDSRALHVPQLVRDALRNMGEPIAAAEVLVLGISYREDVGDTRNSGSELIVRRLVEMGASVHVHDPYVTRWPEMESSEGEDGGSRAQFFSRQGSARNIRPEKDLHVALRGKKAIVFTVRHTQYLALKTEDVYAAVGGPCAIIDCFLMLDDAAIRRYLELGCEVKGLGRGHIKRIKESIRKERLG